MDRSVSIGETYLTYRIYRASLSNPAIGQAAGTGIDVRALAFAAPPRCGCYPQSQFETTSRKFVRKVGDLCGTTDHGAAQDPQYSPSKT